MAPDLDELWTLNDAAAHLRRCGLTIQAGTLRVWIHRGHLDVTKRDHAGRPLVTPLDVARAEYATRAHARRTVAVGRAA